MSEVRTKWPRRWCPARDALVRSSVTPLRATLGDRASSGTEGREPLQFVAEHDPVVTSEVAAVLARIVRGLRDREKGGQA
jgi:hypothetical protein